MEALDKIKKSAEALGVLLEVPAFVDPLQGFSNEKVITWENGDKVKVIVGWNEGSFFYKAILGQIDPKTGEIAYISGPIAEAPSLESLVEYIDAYLSNIAQDRVVAAPEVPEEPVADVPAEEPVADVVDTPAEEVPEIDPAEIIQATDGEPIVVVPDDDAVVDEVPIDDTVSAEDIIAAYNALTDEYQQYLLDPDHEHEQVREMSEKLCDLEAQLRTHGVNPKSLLK